MNETVKEIMNELRKLGVAKGSEKEYFEVGNVERALNSLYNHMERKSKMKEQRLHEEMEKGLFISKEKMLEGAKQTKLNEQEIISICGRHKAGETVSRLAREYGISRGMVLNYLERGREREVLTSLEVTQALEMFGVGKSVDSIRETLKKDDRAIRTEIGKVYGIETPCKSCGKVTMYFKRSQDASPSCPECGQVLEPVKTGNGSTSLQSMLKGLAQKVEPVEPVGETGSISSDFRKRD